MATLEQAGHTLIRTKLPAPIRVFNEAFAMMSRVGMAMVAKHFPGFHELAAANMRELARSGETADAPDFMQASEEIVRLRGMASAWFANHDFLLMPSTAAQPWPIGETHPPRIDGIDVGPRGHAIFTSWVNVIGHPSLSAPVGLDAAGMPVGIQIIGDIGDDARVLAFGQYLGEFQNH